MLTVDFVFSPVDFFFALGEGVGGRGLGGVGEGWGPSCPSFAVVFRRVSLKCKTIVCNCASLCAVLSCVDFEFCLIRPIAYISVSPPPPFCCSLSLSLSLCLLCFCLCLFFLCLSVSHFLSLPRLPLSPLRPSRPLFVCMLLRSYKNSACYVRMYNRLLSRTIDLLFLLLLLLFIYRKPVPFWTST